ncbi:MAG: hypothetical protein KAT48_12145 [Bacteroidales bacterium]|nr:hypothetical protein [Bacteroidales bacterium]
MKNINTLIIAIAIAATSFAQAPQAFKYQAIARDEAGNILINNSIGLRISMVKGNKDGNAKYVETHKVKSNPFGMINLVIGKGEVVKGDFADINWGEESYFVKMEMDITGGTDYKEMGTSQLFAVPYALYAEQAGKIAENESGTATSQPQTVKSKSSANNSGRNRNGTPNTKFPADTSSYLNVNAGYVGIGTTDPQEKLEVTGNIKANHMILADANGNQWEIDRHNRNYASGR